MYGAEWKSVLGHIIKYSEGSEMSQSKHPQGMFPIQYFGNKKHRDFLSYILFLLSSPLLLPPPGGSLLVVASSSLDGRRQTLAEAPVSKGSFASPNGTIIFCGITLHRPEFNGPGNFQLGPTRSEREFVGLAGSSLLS